MNRGVLWYNSKIMPPICPLKPGHMQDIEVMHPNRHIQKSLSLEVVFFLFK